MAITIETEPQLFNPATNPCVFTFSSTQSTELNFSFKVALIVNSTVHSYHDIYPEHSNFGKFDASEILRSLIKSEINVSGSLSYNNAPAILSYSIEVSEKYGSPPVIVGSSVSSNTVNAFNGSLRHQDWVNYNYQNYDLSTTNSSSFLTLFPSTEKYFCGIDETIFLTSLVSNGLSTGLNVTLYDINDSVISQDLNVSLVASKMVIVNASPITLINNTSITGSDFASCYYYEIELTQSGNTSETFRVYYDTECSLYRSRRLHWLNKFGAWESYTFNKYSEESTTTKRSEYKKIKGQWTSSNQWDYYIYGGERFSNSITSNDTLKVNSDWIKENKHNWMVRSLYESPKVYLEVRRGSFEPVIPLDNSYTLKQRIKEGLIQEVVSLARSYTYKSQLN